MADNSTNPVLGIDLGTTFSAIARWDGRGPRVYQGRMGEDVLQSAVYYDPGSDEFLVGQLAFNKGLVNPDNVAVGVKRHMDDASRMIEIGGKEFSPIELSAKILGSLYSGVCSQFPKGLFRSRGTVVTVPYYFKVHQCENTRKAAELAAIDCMGIIQEPIAASLSYAWQLAQDNPDEDREENILVFDLGGGTFDLTLFKLTLTKDKMTFEVLGTGGDDRLGGLDFDNCLADLLIEKSGLDFDGLPEAEKRRSRQKVLTAATEAKKALSFCKQHYVAVPFVVAEKSIDDELTREEFEECIGEYISQVEGVLEGLWGPSNKRPSDVDRVILVGGSSRIPRMKQILYDRIGEDKVYASPDQDLEVVKGAALYAAHLDDPDLLGRDIEVQTRTCHPLGVEAVGGMFDIIVAANRKAPCEGKALFGNAFDNMTELSINVYQGGGRRVRDNTLVGRVQIENLPPKPRGKLDIDVTFKIAEDQNLAVIYEIKDTETGEVHQQGNKGFTFV